MVFSKSHSERNLMRKGGRSGSTFLSSRLYWFFLFMGTVFLLYTLVDKEFISIEWPFDASQSNLGASGKEGSPPNAEDDCHLACCSSQYSKSPPDIPTMPSFYFSNSIKNGTKVRLLSHHGRWVGPRHGDWSILDCVETYDAVGFYTFIETGPHTFRILTPAGTYISASEDRSFRANETEPGHDSEFKFALTKGSGNRIQLKAYDGLYMGCLENGGLFRWSNEPQEWETFSVWKSTNLPSVRGITLSGWLVLENWMASYILGPLAETKSKSDLLSENIPSGLSLEWRIMKSFKLGYGKRILAHHYDTYITEKDFKRIRKENLNTVNIPVGWWVVKFASRLPEWDWVKHYVKVLDKAMDMAHDNHLRVLLTMSARPGPEQNPVLEAQSHWGVFPEAVNEVLKAIDWLSIRYGNHKALLGISILSSELGAGMPEDVKKTYFETAYHIIRNETLCAYVAMAPGSETKRTSLMYRMQQVQKYHNVLSEVFFKNTIFESSVLDFAAAMRDIKVKRLNDIEDLQEEGGMTLVGEWSLGVKEEAQLSRSMLVEFGKTQLGINRRAKGGWLFKSEKTPEAGWIMTNFFDNVKGGYLPKQPDGDWD